MNRRNRIVGECRQVKTDVASHNEAYPMERPIQMVLEFTSDVEGLEVLEVLTEFDGIEKPPVRVAFRGLGAVASRKKTTEE